jgi:hypothetical protein
MAYLIEKYQYVVKMRATEEIPVPKLDKIITNSLYRS